MLKIGKHKGSTFQDVCKTDRSYVSWVLRENPRGFARLAKYVKENHGGVLEVGRYKFHFFDEVLREDPEYCEWALLLKNPGEGFAKFLEYLRANFVHEEPPPKKQKTDNVCKICCDNEIDTVLVPCGHIVACGTCASILKREGQCPICKKFIFLVVKTYVA